MNRSLLTILLLTASFNCYAQESVIELYEHVKIAVVVLNICFFVLSIINLIVNKSKLYVLTIVIMLCAIVPSYLASGIFTLQAYVLLFLFSLFLLLSRILVNLKNIYVALLISNLLMFTIHLFYEEIPKLWDEGIFGVANFHQSYDYIYIGLYWLIFLLLILYIANTKVWTNSYSNSLYLALYCSVIMFFIKTLYSPIYKLGWESVEKLDFFVLFGNNMLYVILCLVLSLTIFSFSVFQKKKKSVTL